MSKAARFWGMLRCKIICAAGSRAVPRSPQLLSDSRGGRHAVEIRAGVGAGQPWQSEEPSLGDRRAEAGAPCHSDTEVVHPAALCVVQESNSGHQLLLPPANWCPIIASRTTHRCHSSGCMLKPPWVGLCRRPRFSKVGIRTHLLNCLYLCTMPSHTAFALCVHCLRGQYTAFALCVRSPLESPSAHAVLGCLACLADLPRAKQRGWHPLQRSPHSM